MCGWLVLCDQRVDSTTPVSLCVSISMHVFLNVARCLSCGYGAVWGPPCPTLRMEATKTLKVEACKRTHIFHPSIFWTVAFD